MPYNHFMPTKLPPVFVFSQSSLQDYEDCPRRFQLRYIEQLHWPAIEAEPVLENERRQQEGQLFHRLAQQAIIGLPTEKLERLASSENLARWWQNFAPQLDGLRAASAAMPEITLSAPVGGHRLLAKFDLITSNTSNRFTIYDWKTYRKRPRNEDMAARLQTRVYRYLLAVAGAHLNRGQPPAPEQIEMIYWYTEFPTEPTILRYDNAQFQRDSDFIEKRIAQISTANDMPMTHNVEKCKFCAYRSYCNRGVKAGTGEDFENGLDIDDITLAQAQEIEF